MYKSKKWIKVVALSLLFILALSQIITLASDNLPNGNSISNLSDDEVVALLGSSDIENAVLGHSGEADLGTSGETDEETIDVPDEPDVAPIGLSIAPFASATIDINDGEILILGADSKFILQAHDGTLIKPTGLDWTNPTGTYDASTVINGIAGATEKIFVAAETGVSAVVNSYNGPDTNLFILSSSNISFTTDDAKTGISAKEISVTGFDR